jgi:DNA-binding response OmpR family regulator
MVKTAHNRTILILDDDQDILEVTKLILEMKGYKVETRDSVVDVVGLVDETNPDIILCDLMIPEIGGKEMIKSLKKTEQTKGIPTLVFSANSEIENISKNIGADGYLKKPFDIEKLELTIESYFQKTE